MPEWDFLDPRARRHYLSVKSAVQEKRFDFDYIKDAFRKGLDEWDGALEGTVL